MALKVPLKAAALFIIFILLATAAPSSVHSVYAVSIPTAGYGSSMGRSLFNITVGPVQLSNGTPASGAVVTADGSEGVCNSSGYATLYLSPGLYTASVSYMGYTVNFTLRVHDNGSASYYIPPIEIEGQKSSIIVGPVLSDGKPLSGVRVSIIYAGQYYNGTTGANGTAIVVVPSGLVGRDVTVRLSKDGYSTVIFAAGVKADGTLTEAPPEMRPLRRENGEGIWAYLVVSLAAAVIMLSLLFEAGRKRLGK